MEKTTGDSCPKCGLSTLNTYYEDGSDDELGAMCDNRGLKAFYVGGKLVPLVVA